MSKNNNTTTTLKINKNSNNANLDEIMNKIDYLKLSSENNLKFSLKDKLRIICEIAFKAGLYKEISIRKNNSNSFTIEEVKKNTNETSNSSNDENNQGIIGKAITNLFSKEDYKSSLDETPSSSPLSGLIPALPNSKKITNILKNLILSKKTVTNPINKIIINNDNSDEKCHKNLPDKIELKRVLRKLY